MKYKVQRQPVIYTKLWNVILLVHIGISDVGKGAQSDIPNILNLEEEKTLVASDALKGLIKSKIS